MCRKSLFTSASERAKSPIEWTKVEAGACVLVATKANEVQRKVRDVVNVVYQRARPNASPLDVGSAFWDLRDAIVASEQDVSAMSSSHFHIPQHLSGGNLQKRS